MNLKNDLDSLLRMAIGRTKDVQRSTGAHEAYDRVLDGLRAALQALQEIPGNPTTRTSDEKPEQADQEVAQAQPQG